MIIARFFGMTLLVLLVAGTINADDEPKLTKKAKSSQPESDKSKLEKVEPEPQPTLKRDDNEKKGVNPGITDSADSPQAKLRRASDLMQDAEKRLSAKDVGEKTRELQRRVLKELDDLLNPPPPPSQPPMDQDMPPPQGGGGSGSESGSRSSGTSGQTSSGGTSGQSQPQNQPSAGSGSQSQPLGQVGTSRRERRQRGSAQPTGTGQQKPNPQPAPMGVANAVMGETKPMSSNSSDKPGDQQTAGKPDDKKPDKLTPPNRVADVYKDIWGHLPEKMRQEMNQYYREQFMPRYSDLLKQYYNSITPRP